MERSREGRAMNRVFFRWARSWRRLVGVTLIATLTVGMIFPAPAGLEAIIRNRQTNDFPNLTQSYYRAFGALPAADEADPLARNMIDIDDGLTLATLKTLKATDQVGDLILESGNQLEDEARSV